MGKRPSFADQLPPMPKSEQDMFQRRQNVMLRWGFILTFLFFAGLFASATKIKLEGAVISQASIVSSGENKTVQHRDGGIVEELLVSNGDLVTAGQPLIVLNDQSIASEYNVSKFRRIELEAKLARLNANLKGEYKYSYQLPFEARRDETALQAVKTQKDLFTANREAIIATETRLNDRIFALNSELSALENQIATTQQELGLIDQQLRDIRPLVQKQLVPKAREWDLLRTQVNARSQLDALNVTYVRTRNNLVEAKNELETTLKDHRQTMLAEVEVVETELQSTEQDYNQLEDRLTRHVIKAPVSGRIHELTVYNADGVVRAGDTLMEIVPNDQGIELSARVQPIDIDQIHVGQKTRLRFDALDANKTPEILGAVSKVSPDTTLDEQTGLSYYTVNVAVDPKELARLGDDDIGPGMPVTAMITTENRTLLSYLMKPLSDQSAYAFR